MLETVKNLIVSLPEVPFDTFYQNYINGVQDKTLGFEIDDMRKADILDLHKLISKLYEEMGI